MTEANKQEARERAILCALDTGRQVLNEAEAVTAAVSASGWARTEAEVSLEELRELARTAGADVVGTVLQARPSADAALYLGQGKIDELKEMVDADRCDLLIFDGELSPTQLRNIEKATGARVVDRTTLILDIFAQRAKSREGRLQVELAQLQYRLPRLAGQGTSLSRLGAGIGTRGPGETKLETDRRHIERRIKAIRQELKSVEKRRNMLRARREKNGVETVVLVGYTNAGKSTLMNTLTEAGVLAEDKLFATLDPTSRALRLPSGRNVMLIDTVGLVRNLPHQLVEAFHSTLEEAASADVILNICDASSPEYEDHLRVTEEVLKDLGAEGIPTLRVMNKCDLIFETPHRTKDTVYLSAKNGSGVTLLLEAVEEACPKPRVHVRFRFPFEELSQASILRDDSAVLDEVYTEDGLELEVICSARMADHYKDFLTEQNKEDEHVSDDRRQ
ncbi:MAG: GTPase HflX [Clostridia bacterium]|nr:GTPase HflX [Clostridia bacterium]